MHRNKLRVLIFVCMLVAPGGLRLEAQNTATLSGVVLDPTGAAVPEALVTVKNPATGFTRSDLTNSNGEFSISNIPFHTYEVVVEKPGFSVAMELVSLRTNVPVVKQFTLVLDEARVEVTVAEDMRLLVDPEETGTHLQMNQTDIERMALQSGNRGLEGVLATFPGFAQNANGAIHPRGAHNQMTFVIDGMPVSDQLTGAFANAIDPNIVQTVELFTGNIPAEYGNKVSAVANITTKSGLGAGRRFGGSTMVSAAQFNLLSQVTQVAGENGKLGYSAVLTAMKTHRYLDQVSLDNLHNGGNNQRVFSRLDYQASNRDTLRLNLMFGNAPFELANLRSQHANGMNQRQLLRDWSATGGWLRALSAQTTVDANLSYRMAGAQLFPSPGDTPVTAAQARRTVTFTGGARLNHVRGPHNFRGGFDILRFPVREHFSFAITSANFNPPDSPDFVETLLPFDLTRGGRHFHFSKKRTGGMYSGFLQDNVRLGRWQFSLGMRYDNYRFLVNAVQWQPRVGVSFHIRETNTVLRASYNRTLQTPPNENLLLSNSQESAALVQENVRETVGGDVVLIRPETQNIFEVGFQQGLGQRVSVNGAFYHKNSRNAQDNNNFFDTGIIFPISLRALRVNGAEGRIVLTPVRGISATLSLTHNRAVATPPFTGGLFLGQSAVEVLSQGPFLIDHDQTLSAHGMLSYTSKKGFYWTLSTRYDSGLVANPSDPEEVARDPDFADLLPYVNLTSEPARVRPRTIADVVVGYERSRDGRRRWDASLQITNLTDRTALYNFQSLFVGTRLVQPRTFGGRLRWYF